VARCQIADIRDAIGLAAAFTGCESVVHTAGRWGHGRVSVAVGLLNVALGLLAWLAVAVPSTLFPACLAALGLLSAAYLAVERMRPMTTDRKLNTEAMR
jgi:hypothetical protein